MSYLASNECLRTYMYVHLSTQERIIKLRALLDEYTARTSPDIGDHRRDSWKGEAGLVSAEPIAI